jgi:SAM-dependent methyltransferase
MTSKFSYGLVIFSSAFLLFQVQPLLGKIILPWFGGAAGVWIVCLLFFQVVLLLGYFYAHLLTRNFRARTQIRVHVALLIASFLLLPIVPKESWKPSSPFDPAFHILLVLGVTVGLPYFLLSSTSPLLQAWYAKNDADAAPYRFYAVSNTGSMLALVSYPILIEPWFATSHQAVGWSWAYAAVALFCVVVALASSPQAPLVGQLEIVPSPPWEVQALWIGLAACGSALLLAFTHHISQNIASVPLLWVIPLALYLLTFILCFEGRAWYRRDFFLRLLGVALGSMAYALAPSFAGLPLSVSIPLYCGCLFVCCMFCHGELARLKPHPSHLTSFYLMCSLGGAIGAFFVALVAPWLFSGDYELRIALGCCALLVLVVNYRDPESPFYRARWQPAWLLMVTLALTIVVSLAVTAREEAKSARVMVRNFYGVLRILDQRAANVVLVRGEAVRPPDEDPRFEKLMNGTIDHGLEFLSPARRDQPTTYYGPASGVGITLRSAEAAAHLKVGVIGLGAGTLAVYGRPGDYYEFYEINPLVVQIANQDFNFLRDSKAKIDIILGDARLSLEHEPAQGFDVLVVDAFSGDSIPVHLLTHEAFELFFRQLQPGGVLAVHISNQYLDLAPVVAGAATWLRKEAVMIKNEPDGARGISRATWILVGNPQRFLGQPEIERAGTVLGAASPQIRWTDDYSSLFKALK